MPLSKPLYTEGLLDEPSLMIPRTLSDTNRNTGSCKKNPAKFGDTSSVRADGLCIGCLGQWAERGREDSNMQEFFCTTLYLLRIGQIHTFCPIEGGTFL